MTGLRPRRLAPILLAVSLLAGCASATPSPVTSMRQLEGKWQGTITVGMGTPQFYYLTISPDGALAAQWGTNWQWGKVTLGGQQPRFEISGLTSGSMQYYDAPSGRSITMNPDFGGWYVYVTPVK